MKMPSMNTLAPRRCSMIGTNAHKSWDRPGHEPAVRLGYPCVFGRRRIGAGESAAPPVAREIYRRIKKDDDKAREHARIWSHLRKRFFEKTGR